MWRRGTVVLFLCGLRSAGQVQPLSLRMVGQIGGPTQAVAVQGNYAYVGVGVRLVVLDVSNPATMREVGATAPFPHFVEGVAVSGKLAYVAAGGAGLRVVDISDPTRPAEVGAFDTRGYSEGIAVAGTTVYLADGPYGLRIFDVSTPKIPKEVGSAYVMNYAFEVAVAGRYAYVAAAGAGLLVADVSDPAHPVEVSTLETPGYAYGVAVAANTVYVADGWEGLRIVSVAAPARPVVVGSYKTPGWAFGVAISGTRAYVADALMGLRILEISNPAQPAEIGAYEPRGDARSAVVAGSAVYVADRRWGLRAVDVGDPAHPREVGSCGFMGDAWDIALQGSFAYVAAGFFGLHVVDVSDRKHPREVGAYPTQSSARAVQVVGRWAYVITGEESADRGLHVVDVSEPAQPRRVGFYGIEPGHEETGGAARGLAVTGGIAYIANEHGLLVIDVANASTPRWLGFIRLDQHEATMGVAVKGNTAYVIDGSNLMILDISRPSSPRLVGLDRLQAEAVAIAVAEEKVYLGGTRGLSVVDVSDPVHPRDLGAYRMPAWAVGVAISGTLVYVAASNAGVEVVDVSNSSTLTLVGSYDTLGCAYSVRVSGDYVYVADGEGGLAILEARPSSGAASSGTELQSAGVITRETDGHSHQSLAPRAGLAPPTALPSVRDQLATNRDHTRAGPGLSFPGIAPKSPPVASVHASLGAVAATATCTVVSALDSGPGTLRSCLENAASGATITFDPSQFPAARPVSIPLTRPLPELNGGQVTIDASNAGVILDGSGLPLHTSGLVITSSKNVLKGLQIRSGVSLERSAQYNQIGGAAPAERNTIGWIDIRGRNANHNTIVGNYFSNIQIKEGASSNRVGGTGPGERNFISGAISIEGAETVGNFVVGNYVGTDVNGTTALPGRSERIWIDFGASNNVVHKNVIGGYSNAGIEICNTASFNSITGNLIGTDASGTIALGGGERSGVGLGAAAGFNRIGGKTPEERNVIAGNQFAISLGEGTGNLVLGNFIGTDARGTKSLGNSGDGLLLLGGSRRSFIGGTTKGERNLISGNGGGGVAVPSASDWNFIAGNYIGTDASGRVALGNQGGVDVRGDHNVIQGNTIAHDFRHGVQVGEGFAFSTIRRNSIYSHTHTQTVLGICLLQGANKGIRAPSVTILATTGVRGTACPDCEIEIFSDAEDEGRIFEGSTVAGSSGAFSFEKGGPLTGPNITATATDGEGNTSQFSRPRKMVQTAGPLLNVSAASYAGDPLAAESIVTAFGSDLATTTESPTTLPLPTVLAGTTVKLLDSAGVERPAALYFVSPAQVNYQIPPGTALGTATVAVTSAGGVKYAASVEIVSVAPGLFSASGTGQGLAAANVLRVRADGSQSYEPVIQPIDLGPGTDQVYLLLYGTGIRKRSSLAAVRLSIGGTGATVSYAGPQPEYPGLDQVNALLPRTLRGRGDVEVVLTVDGKAANSVRVNIR